MNEDKNTTATIVAEIAKTFERFERENFELKTRLEKAVELPMITKSPYNERDIFTLYYQIENKAIVCESFFTRDAAEARSKELEEK